MNKSSYKRPADVSATLCLILLFAAAGMTWYLGHRQIAVYEAVAAVAALVVVLISRVIRNKRLMQYIESVAYEAENAKNNTLTNFPLPIAVFKLEDSRVVWGNKQFFDMCGSNPMRLDTHISDFMPDFSSKWLKDGKDRYPGYVEVNGKKYKLCGSLIQSDEEATGSVIMGICYWIDATEYDALRTKFANTRPVVGAVILDNYDELVKNQTERMKNDIRDTIEDKLNSWMAENNGIIRRTDRDRYIFFIEHERLDFLREEKFKILEQIREVSSPSGITASISIGIGCDSPLMPELLSNSQAAAELALSRGGDQAVVKGKLGFEFFGGKGSEVEKRTKVRSRVMANTLGELMKDSSKVLIMGHTYSDLDSLGSSVGLAALSRCLGVKANILVDAKKTAAVPLLEKMKKLPEYADTFINEEEAILRIDGKTLLIVVDTNRPEQTESEDVLLAAKRVAVIDHHRVAATSISNAAITFIEPYASSVCELICELLQELADNGKILKDEADAMLAGIVLDTKNFTIRTGERTFDAAAYLRRLGADTVEVKKLLQMNMDDTVARYKILQGAQLYRGIAIAAPKEKQNRIVCAQAADELLNISGVDASVVIYKDSNGDVLASARSIGDFNAQIVMEKLGGGGNKSAAAVKFEKGTDLNMAFKKLREAVDDYLNS